MITSIFSILVSSSKTEETNYPQTTEDGKILYKNGDTHSPSLLKEQQETSSKLLVQIVGNIFAVVSSHAERYGDKQTKEELKAALMDYLNKLNFV